MVVAGFGGCEWLWLWLVVVVVVVAFNSCGGGLW